jgi:hypothetical protein
MSILDLLMLNARTIIRTPSKSQCSVEYRIRRKRIGRHLGDHGTDARRLMERMYVQDKLASGIKLIYVEELTSSS